MADQQYTEIEIHAYPEDCLASELEEYFRGEPYRAASLTASNKAWKDQLKVYIFKFSPEDAERILEASDHYLEEGDEESRIQVRRYEAPPKKWLVTGNTKLNSRMLKRHLKRFGEVNSHTPLSDDKLQFVITFSSTEGTEKLASTQTLELTAELIVTVEEYTDISTYSSSAMMLSSVMTEGDQSQVVEPIRDVLVIGEGRLNVRGLKKVFKEYGEVETYTKWTDDNLQFIVTFVNAEDAERVANMKELPMGAEMKVRVQLHEAASETSSFSGSTHSGFRPAEGSRSSTPQSFLHQSDGASSLRLPPLGKGMVGAAGATGSSSDLTHVEIERLPDESAENIYTLLNLHLKEVFGESFLVTEMAHSYDEIADRFRFDATAAEINVLISAKQQLEEGDDSTTLNIRPLTTGRDVQLKVTDKPKNVTLGVSHLYKRLGMSSNFRSRLYIQLNQDGADLRMETCSVASLVVSIGEHVLDNKIVLEASFPSTAVIDSDITCTDTEPTANVLLVQTTTSSVSLFKKLIRSKLKAKLIDELEKGKYLIECETEEEAAKLAEQKTVKFEGNEMHFSLHRLVPPAVSYTHIEVRKHAKPSPVDMHMLLVLHFGEVLGRNVASAFEHSYDSCKELFRFDISSADISILCGEPQSMDCEDEMVELSIHGAVTDKRLLIKTGSAGKLTKAALEKAFGPASPYASTLEIIEFSDTKAKVEMETCSVAARIVSAGRHTLSNVIVQAKFEGEEAKDGGSDMSSDVDDVTNDVTDDVTDKEEEPIDNETTTAADSDDTCTLLSTNTDDSDTLPITLLLSNLADADESIIYFWLKSLTGVWASSIQLSVAGDSAIVKVPAGARLDSEKLKATEEDGYELCGEKVSITEAPSPTQVQVICSSSNKGARIEDFTLESFLNSPKYTHVSMNSLQCLQLKTLYNGLQVFVATYSTYQDVCNVLGHRPYCRGPWTFDVMEFYPEIGVCDSSHVYTCEHVGINSAGLDVEKKQPIVHINNIDVGKTDIEMLEFLMANRKRPTGGEIKSWNVISDRSAEAASVQVIYKEEGVAERVYEYYKRNGLTSNGINLELELELPWLGPDHDDRKVRVSGLSDDLDPEMLKFYLSALSENVVTEMFFNKSQTRAVALFKDPIDYSKILEQARIIPLKDCPLLRIQAEYKTKDLIATGGNLTEEDLELPLDNMLHMQFNRDVDVRAEKLPDSADMWKITTEPEALEFILKQKNRIPRCKTLAPYSEFLGLHVTSGVRNKSHSLSRLVPDPKLLNFLMQAPDGQQPLRTYLRSEGFELSVEGEVMEELTRSSTSGRCTEGNWKTLRPRLERFIDETFLVHQFDNVSEEAKPDVLRLLDGRPLSVSFKPHGNAECQISIAGIKQAVQACQMEVPNFLKKLEREREERARVKEVMVPNVMGYQIQYLTLTDFFNKMMNKHELVSFVGNVERNSVSIQGNDHGVQAVKNILFDLMYKMQQSKVSMDKQDVFMKVFQNELTQQIIKSELLQNKISAVWCMEDDTTHVYADSKATSHTAIKCIDSVIWYSLYPSEQDLDELEIKLVTTNEWGDKVFELEKLFNPLAISELPDKRRLCLSTLEKFQGAVVEEIQLFFDQSITRTTVFNGVPNRILFLKKYQMDSMRTLSTRNRVKIGEIDPERGIELAGLKNHLNSFVESLKKVHDDICKQLHVIAHQAMIRHINADPDFLEAVCMRTNCLVVPHKEEVITEQKAPLSGSVSSRSGTRYSVTLPSGTVCEVRKADLTAMTCDAIINAANGRLQHMGGLALAIVKKGGVGIQEECTDYVDSKGSLNDGDTYTSAAGKLNCKKIIHAVGPRWRGGHSGEERVLLSCVDNCFLEAEKHQLLSVAFPPISTGIFHYPLPDAIRTIVDAVNNRELNKSFLPQQVIFADIKDDSLALFERELRGRFERATDNSCTDRRPKSGGNDKYSVNGSNILIMNRVKVEILKGNLVNTRTDSLVNSVGSDFKLNHGQVAKAIVARAGPRLQRECDTLGPIAIGDVKETDAFQLPCKKIVHCNCPEYEGPATIPLLKELVISCLRKAAYFGHQSIAFPSLGTGNLRYPEREVAKAMIEAVMEYTERNPRSTISDVKIVLYHLDMAIQKSFEDELHRLATHDPAAATLRKRNLTPKDVVAKHSASTSSLPEPVLKATLTGGLDTKALKGCVTVNHTSIRVIQGDITEHRASVLVNSTDSMLSIRGQVSKALVKKAGPEVKEEINTLAKEASVDGIWISSAGNLNADHIFHVDAQSPNWARFITSCLRMCDANDITSIAFPAIGTGALGKPVKEMAQVILQTTVGYINDHPKTSLTGVDVVIFQPGMVKDFVESMQKAIEKKDSWTQRIGLKLSQWFSTPTDTDTDQVAAAMPQAPIGQALLNMDIYGSTAADIEACKRELDKKLGQALQTITWNTKTSYKEDKHHIAKMSTSQVQKLLNEAAKLSVNLEVDQQRCNITIVGLRNDAFKMSEMVSAELRSIENETNETKEATLVAMAIQWSYDEGDGTMVEFNTRVNKDIEGLYSKNPNASFSFATADGQVELNFSKMTGRDSSSVEFKIERIDKSEEPATIFKVPDPWVPPLDKYSEHVVDTFSDEFKAVERNFMATFQNNDPDWAFLPKTGKVLEVRRVQNPTLYQQYIVLRKETARRLNKPEDEVERVPMWHGTNEGTVSKITAGRFDRALSGKNATVYGCGSYFATCSWYSRQDTYSVPNAQGHQFMIQTRVIVGEYCRGKKGYIEAPYKKHAPTQKYESVVNNVRDPVIFVVFNDAAAFPEYIVRFQCPQ